MFIYIGVFLIKFHLEVQSVRNCRVFGRRSLYTFLCFSFRFRFRARLSFSLYIQPYHVSYKCSKTSCFIEYLKVGACIVSRNSSNTSYFIEYLEFSLRIVREFIFSDTFGALPQTTFHLFTVCFSLFSTPRGPPQNSFHFLVFSYPFPLVTFLPTSPNRGPSQTTSHLLLCAFRFFFFPTPPPSEARPKTTLSVCFSIFTFANLLWGPPQTTSHFSLCCLSLFPAPPQEPNPNHFSPVAFHMSFFCPHRRSNPNLF